MSVTFLRGFQRHAGDAALVQGRALVGQTSAHPAPARKDADSFGIALVRAGLISARDLLSFAAKPQARLVDQLIGSGLLAEDRVYAALAGHWAIGLADFVQRPIDGALIRLVDPAASLPGAWIPWRKLGPTTLIACAYPEDMEDLRAKLTPIFGPVSFALAPRSAIEAQTFALMGSALARRAETRLPAGDSCRDFSARHAKLGLGLVLAIFALGAAVQPTILLAALVALALLIAYVQTFLKVIAALATLRGVPAGRPPPLPRPDPPAPDPAKTPHLRLVPTDNVPKISLMVPLFRESRIVARLLRRLDQIDYPRTALEVLFMIEDNDSATKRALAGLDLPHWMRVLAVPTGTIRTKPRALNYGLDHCTGEIVGVYDAEDAPDAGQLRAVAAGFAAGDARLACLQGRLDYYNPRHNWMARCFTMEYATWWRVVLPGFIRMGFVIPLGGTTLFFRRSILQDLGGWDAHNVTEDADLGLRLVRRGYQTQLFDSTTYEEANCRALPWVKQRSRWIKGYIMTYAAHMRSPRALLRDLGPWRFFGVQMMFAGTVLQALLAPAFVALWLVAFGIIEGNLTGLGAGALQALAAMAIISEAAGLMVAYLGIRRAGASVHPIWIPTMAIYNLLATLAAYKAVYEVATKPFFWDKTTHGLFDDEKAGF